MGLEPTTLRLKVWCSTDWANRASLAVFVFFVNIKWLSSAFDILENPRRGRQASQASQARNLTTNVPKILDLKTSSEQMFSENCRWVSLSTCEVTGEYFIIKRAEPFPRKSLKMTERSQKILRCKPCWDGFSASKFYLNLVAASGNKKHCIPLHSFKTFFLRINRHSVKLWSTSNPVTHS